MNSQFPSALKIDNSVLMNSPFNDFSEKEKKILEKMEQLKQPGNSIPEGDNILKLQKEIEKTNGSTITRQEANDIGTIIPASNYSPLETDNLDFSYLMYGDGNYVAGIAAQVEQTGPTAGKIWVALGEYNGDTGVFALPDTIKIFYSVNNGLSYNLYASIAFSGHNKIDFDNMDMEIIENTTGQKYLHIVFGYFTDGGYGQSLIGYTVVSAPALTYAGSTLFPPGYNANSKYTKARITSDNVRFPSNPYITIVLTQDSIAGSDHYFISKMCRVLSPFTVSPAVTYLSQSIYTAAAGYNDNVFTDVANYNNVSDSLIFVLSSYPGYESGIYFYKAYSNSVVYPAPKGSYTPTGDNVEFARIAANGGSNQKDLFITYSDNYLNTGDFDQWVMYTTDASNWLTFSVDFTSFNNSKYGDVIGRRNAKGSFSLCFKNIYGNMENVSAYSFSNLISKSSMHALNTDYANSSASPKPLFRYVNNDSCLNIWSYFYSVSSTGGCAVSNLYVRAALEGYYDENTDEQSVFAPVHILLAESTPPYNVVDTGFAYMDVQGMSNVYTFPRALTGNYYLIAKHFNCIETWSSAPVYVAPNTFTTYDFTTGASQAFGDNMVQKGSRWCLYSGDVNQNGTIDLNDVVSIYNDASEFVAVLYAVTDLNGDSVTDLSDLLIGFNNS
ncbi:MAG TPA: hypothetical protein PKA90_08660, partial [Ignavibacteria bacterium]|nr:hypothetical protein [Ignavibacteria bacterium]